MVEIIVLFNITRSIGRLAEQKGLKPGVWKMYVILAWFGAELFTGVLAYLLVPGIPVLFLLAAYAGAAGSYYLIRSTLRKKPDLVDDEWISQIGVPEEQGDKVSLN